MQDRFNYHFSLIVEFEKDAPVDQIEKLVGLTAHKKTPLKDSKAGVNGKKTAKIWWKTPKYCEPNTMLVIERFLEKFAPKIEVLKSYFEEFSGSGGFNLIFTKTTERPIIGLSERAMEILSCLNLQFMVDFC